MGANVLDPRGLPSALLDAITCLGSRVDLARRESAKLVAMRDALLPELMSGRLRVKDAVRTVEEVL